MFQLLYVVCFAMISFLYSFYTDCIQVILVFSAYLKRCTYTCYCVRSTPKLIAAPLISFVYAFPTSDMKFI